MPLRQIKSRKSQIRESFPPTVEFLVAWSWACQVNLQLLSFSLKVLTERQNLLKGWASTKYWIADLLLSRRSGDLRLLLTVIAIKCYCQVERPALFSLLLVQLYA